MHTKVNEQKVKKLLEKHGLNVHWIDSGKVGDNANIPSRPDYFVYHGEKVKTRDGNIDAELFSKDGFVCEVKSIFSAGSQSGGMISTVENYRYFPKGTDGRAVDVSKRGQHDAIRRGLDKAVSQFEELVKDWPAFRKKPFFIALFEDFFVGRENVPDVVLDYKQISGVLFLVEDRDKRKAVKYAYAARRGTPNEKLRSFLKDPPSLPPLSNTWLVFRNKCADIPVDSKFCEVCFGDYSWFDE